MMRATTLTELHACALATMVSGPAQVEVFERVFNELFGPGGPRPPVVTSLPAVTAPRANMGVGSVEGADASAEGSAPSAGDDEPPVRLPGLDEALAGGGAGGTAGGG